MSPCAERSVGDQCVMGAAVAWPADLIERYLSPIPEAGYNYVQRWDYSLLAEAMCNKSGKYKVYKVQLRIQLLLAAHVAPCCRFA